MAKTTFVDLERKPYTEAKLGPKGNYPTISVGGSLKFDPEVGDEVVLKGTVIRCVEDEEGDDFTIEITEASCDCAGDLEDAMNKIAKKKAKAADLADEVD